MDDEEDDNKDSGFYCLGCDDIRLELDCIKEQQDLQLAAELGNTLLERNKDLESTIKHQQGVIEDQIQEIEFLTKQTAALKEVNESRVKIYEQIEISLSELETNNLRLSEDSAVEKSKIKRFSLFSSGLTITSGLFSSLTTTVTALENRCEELQRSLEEAEIIIRNRKERRNSIFLQQNPNSDSLCLNCSKPNEKSSRKNSQIFFYEGSSPEDQPQPLSAETLGIAALFVESLNCSKPNNSQQCKLYQDVACDQQDLLEAEGSAISSLEEQAATERMRIRELEDQIEALLSEKTKLVCSVKELKLSQSSGELESNNNHRQSDSSRMALCARCSVLEGEEEEPLKYILPLLEGVWNLILSLLSPAPHMTYLDVILFSTSLATLLLGFVSSVAAMLAR